MKLFGTDGIRGLANIHPMSPEVALRLGRVLGARVCRENRGTVVLGRDTRRSGTMLEAAVTAGLCSAGADVTLAGVLPTPAVAYLTRSTGAGAGVVISASHNPFADNGIKIFGADGFKLTDVEEFEIESAILAGEDPSPRPTGAAIGRARTLPDADHAYVAAMIHSLGQPRSLAGQSLVVDCANGAAASVAPRLFQELGMELEAIGTVPDGDNINADCGAVHPESLQRAMRERPGAIGIAVDGDADRLIMADENGTVVDGDELLGVLAADLLARGELRTPVVVGTVMSNLGLELALRQLGIELRRTPVGDRFVVEEMKRRGCQLGGESSGHLILLDHSTTGDALLAALHVLEVVARSGRPLADLRRDVRKMPQALVNVRVASRAELAGLPAVAGAIANAEAVLHDRGRVLVRYSGTEPLVRVMVECENDTEAQRLAASIADALRQALG